MESGRCDKSILPPCSYRASTGNKKASQEVMTERVRSLIPLQTNCLSEIRFQAAETDAQRLDEHFLRTGQLLGPLHGLPISLQDKFNVEGLESACGYVSWLGERKDGASEGVLIKRLRHLGAIFFVKTNVPMSMLVGLYIILLLIPCVRLTQTRFRWERRVTI
jgi:Asp-tRNA(Asn)/Glu-tRNA(Gln) amidotransferase A subunit family amidase